MATAIIKRQRKPKPRSIFDQVLYNGVRLVNGPDLENVARLDQAPMRMIITMMRNGTAIDRDYLREVSVDLGKKADDLEKEIKSYIPKHFLDKFIADSSDSDDKDSVDDLFNVNSASQIAELLFDVLEVGEGLELKTTPGGDRISTGKKQLEVLKKRHPIIPKILQYREYQKLKSTYADTLPEIAIKHNRGTCLVCLGKHTADHFRVHSTFGTTRAATGRLNSSNPNLQNIPTRTAEGRRIRAAFIPQPGYRLVGRDYSQIELRILAQESQDPVMVEVFRRGEDIHLRTAMEAFNLAAEAVDKMLHRAPCKNVNFGIVYGLTDVGLYDQMAITYATAGKEMPEWITKKWCGEFIEKWFGVYALVRPYMEEHHTNARRWGMTWDRVGRARLVPEVYSEHRRVVQAGLRQAGNMPIQSFAAAIIKLAMGQVQDMFDGMNERLRWAVNSLLSVHDELIAEAPEDLVEEVDESMGEEMDSVIRLDVPVVSEGKVMERWVKE